MDDANTEFGVFTAEALAFAQMGKLEEARQIIAQVRAMTRIELYADLAVSVMVVEGVCQLYDGQPTLGLDRLTRATAVAMCFGNRGSRALAKCWLSLCELNMGRHLGAAQSVITAYRLVSRNRPDVRSKIASVMAMLFEFSGKRETSIQWFQVSRQEAGLARQPALMSSAIYNSVMFRISSRRVDSVFDPKGGYLKIDEANLKEIESSINFDALSRASVQPALHELLKAVASEILKRHNDAVGFSRQYLGASSSKSATDIAIARFCLAWNLHQSGLPVDDFAELRDSLRDLHDLDDLAIAHHVLFHIVDRDADPDGSIRTFHEQAYRAYLKDLKVLRSDVAALLEQAGVGDLSQSTSTGPAAWRHPVEERP